MNWYKLAKNCQEYQVYAIENLSPDFIRDFTSPTSNVTMIFEVLGLNSESFTEADIEDAKRCLRRLWHPDVNSENKDVATSLFKALDMAVNFALALLGKGAKNDTYHPYGEEEVSTSGKYGVFENVVVGDYEGESNPKLFVEDYQDISGIPTDLYSTGEDHKLTIRFAFGNEIHVSWRNNSGGMWARGNFANIDDRNWTNFWQFSMNSAAKTVARTIQAIVSAGISVIGFDGSPILYKKIKEHLEANAKDAEIRATSMGETNWEDIQNHIKEADLEMLSEIAKYGKGLFATIITKYMNQYGAKLSNRYMPWSTRERELSFSRAYPIINVLRYFPAWVEKVLSGESSAFADEEQLKQRLYETLRRQMEKSEKKYPISNKNSETYRIVSVFYSEMDEAIKELLSFLV